MKIRIIVCLFLTLPYLLGAQKSKFITKKYLVDLENKKNSLSQHIHNQSFVLIFLSAECPISQKYAPILRGMQEQYSEVKFVAVFTKWDKTLAIQEYLKNYPLSMRVLRDKKNNLIKKIDARITPEAFLFDKNGVLIYRGAIDNWFYSLGKYRPEASEHYLADAIQLSLKNELIKIKQTDAIGCIIEK